VIFLEGQRLSARANSSVSGGFAIALCETNSTLCGAFVLVSLFQKVKLPNEWPVPTPKLPLSVCLVGHPPELQERAPGHPSAHKSEHRQSGEHDQPFQGNDIEYCCTTRVHGLLPDQKKIQTSSISIIGAV
jgi:hypothetical protein